jgi:hypothetical protein
MKNKAEDVVWIVMKYIAAFALIFILLGIELNYVFLGLRDGKNGTISLDSGIGLIFFFVLIITNGVLSYKFIFERGD